MRRPIGPILGQAALAALGASALIAAGTCAVWVRRPELVEALDASLRRRHERSWERAHLSAARALERDPAAGVRALETLAIRLEDFLPGDRRYPLRREVLGELVAASLLAGDPERALAWAESWAALSDRDLPAALARAEALEALPERVDEAGAWLRELYERFPEVPEVHDAYGRFLLRRGDARAALAVVLAAAESPPALSEPWALEWDTGSGAFERPRYVRPRRVEGRWQLELELPRHVTRIRLRHPHLSGLLVRPELVAGETVTALWKEPVELSGLELRGDTLVADDREAALVLAHLPDRAGLGGITLRAECRPRVSGVARDLLDLPGLADLVERERPGSLPTWDALRRSAEAEASLR